MSQKKVPQRYLRDVWSKDDECATSIHLRLERNATVNWWYGVPAEQVYISWHYSSTSKGSCWHLRPQSPCAGGTHDPLWRIINPHRHGVVSRHTFARPITGMTRQEGGTSFGWCWILPPHPRQIPQQSGSRLLSSDTASLINWKVWSQDHVKPYN